ncbi:LysM peptidoglycan-binding domain-containing protein [Sinomonas mesophila]|uniref:LysM peptidoglycan-binding domain-containing protein n=1 Tax=Sinomonas mesophila TaxID=1531955 RepID=UPI000986E323|nr:Gmad2 immunoglobulin-like domain-containing protein [Sinomonas mesophila]
MPHLPQISLRSPVPFDILGAEVAVTGLAAAFEAVYGSVTVRDATGTIVAASNLIGGGNAFSLFHAALGIGSPSTPEGTVTIEGTNASGLSENVVSVTVQVTFGTVLMGGTYSGFLVHTVVPGNTLSGLADQYYGDPNLYGRIFTANRDTVFDPDLIYAGQALRIPLG